MRSLDHDFDPWEGEGLPHRTDDSDPQFLSGDWWLGAEGDVDQALAVLLHKRPSIGRVLTPLAPE